MHAQVTVIELYVVVLLQGIELVPEEEWKHLLEALLQPGHVTYRISERQRRTFNPYEGKSGTLTYVLIVISYYLQITTKEYNTRDC